jgi:O-antigen ligase
MPIALFLLGGALGLAVAYDPRLTLPWLAALFAGAAIYGTVVLLGREPRRVLWCAGVLALSAAAFALLLGAQYRHLGFDAKFGPVARLGGLLSRPFPRLVAARIDANAAAAFLEVALPLAIGLALSARGWRRGAWSAAAAFIALGVLLTASRGAWAALAVAAALGVLAATAGHGRLPAFAGRRFALALGLLAAALLGAALLLLRPTPLQRVLDSAIDRAGDRLTLYRNSFLLALDFPFTGIGGGATFGEVYSRFQLLIQVPFVGYAHNLLLGIWLAQGLLGLLGFAALLLASGRLVARGLRRPDGPLPALRWSAAVGCAVALLHGLTDAPQYDTAWPAMLMIWGCFGVAVAAARLADDRPLTWLRPRRGQAVLFAGAALVAMALAGPALLALACANAAAVLQARAQLAPGLTDTERAALRHDARWWAGRGHQIEPASAVVLAREGHLAALEGDFAQAEHDLVAALAALPADQSIAKQLGYTCIWRGDIERGVALLQALDRRSEIRQELDVWPVAWRERGRGDLAVRAEQAARLLASGGD